MQWNGSCWLYYKSSYEGHCSSFMLRPIPEQHNQPATMTMITQHELLRWQHSTSLMGFPAGKSKPARGSGSGWKRNNENELQQGLSTSCHADTVVWWISETRVVAPCNYILYTLSETVLVLEIVTSLISFTSPESVPSQSPFSPPALPLKWEFSITVSRTWRNMLKLVLKLFIVPCGRRGVQRKKQRECS